MVRFRTRPQLDVTHDMFTVTLLQNQSRPSEEPVAMVDVTLTADEDLLGKARAYAQARNTTLDQLDRDYLPRLTGQLDPEGAAEEFAELARSQPGRSDESFAFDRREAHARPGGVRQT